MSVSRFDVGQLVLTSSTPPGNLGLYAKDENTIGVVGDLVCIDPKSKAESSVVTSIVDPVTGMIKSVSGGGKSVLQAAAMTAKARSNIELIGIGSVGTGSSTSVTGRTWQRIVAARSQPLAVRISYQNFSAVEYTVDKTNITPSSTFVLGDPTGGASPVNVLFSGSAPAVVPAGTAALPSEIMSDWTYIAPIARADAGTYPLEYIRSYIENGGATAYPYIGSSQYAGNPANSVSGLVRTAGFQAGDFIATPTGFTDNSGLRLPMNVEFKELARVIRVASIGDSITSSYYATAAVGACDNNITDQALALINPSAVSYGTILSHINCGITSQTIPQILARLPQILANHSPDIVVLPVWSPNSAPSTQAGIYTNNGLIVDAINQILASGSAPVLCTSPPQNSTTSAIDALRVANNALWRTIAAGCGYFLADFALVFDGAPISSVTQYAGSYSTDGTHPNATGQAAVAPILADTLKSAAGLM